MPTPAVVMRLLCAFLGTLTLCVAGGAQTFIDEVRFTVLEPAGAIRPLEEAILKVEIYGTLRSKDGSEQRGLLPLDYSWIAFEKKNTGWVSKAFQCPDFSPRNYVRERRGGWMDVLNTVQDFNLKNCYLYTAPKESGRYRLQASKDGVAGDVYVEVSNSAPSRRPQESITFGEEPRSNDPYLPLVEHYAPFIAQEAWFNPLADAITRSDYDGDWSGDNNWDNLGKGSSQAYVYYAVMETSTHWFLHYNFFHPRDYSDLCAVGSCHENDNEGLILAVRKDGSRFGKVEAMETLAHNLLMSYVTDPRIEGGAQDLNGAVAFQNESHPMIFIEAGGHGVAGANDSKYTKYDHVVNDWLPGSTGITYVYKGQAEHPEHAGATEVGYALLPIYEHWWLRAIDPAGQTERTFADYYSYQPVGDRPVPPVGEIPAAFLGTVKSANKARPFWGWHDDRTLKAGILARGQWALDPAYSFSKNLQFPPDLPVSLDYTFNPYLGIGMVKGATMPQSNPMPAGSAPAATTPAANVPDAAAKPSLDGWGEPASKSPSTDGWGDPPSDSKPKTDSPQGWGDPQKPKPQYPEGWGPPPRE